MGRKRNLRDKLSGANERPGWMDTINPPGAEEEAPSAPATGRGRSRRAQPDPDAIRRKTYLLNEQLIQRIERLAERERVGINELVRYLLSESVAAVEAREWKIPTKPAKRTIVQD